MKKRCAALCMAILLLAGLLCGCRKDTYKGMNETAEKYARISVELNREVKNKYWLDDTLFAFHYYPNYNEEATGTLDTAFAWPYTELVASNWRIATLNGALKKQITPFYKKTLEGFEYYRAMRKDYHTYCATRASETGMAGGDTYYDDNIWISREFLNAYEMLGDQNYLAYSVAVAQYVWSGWADDALGGIYWCEQKKNSRNTCSNAPAALLFARLYHTTGDAAWLERAQKVYAWTYKTLRDPSDNVYWDNISNEGKINTWKFTYNTGSMIGAAVKLYELTHEEAYLEQAKASALGAHEHWFKQQEGKDYRVITSDNPWFNVLLLDAWVELYPYDKEGTMPYIADYEANLNHAYSMRADGLMPADWANGWKQQDGAAVLEKVNVLDMAANAENMGTLAYFYQYVKGE